VPIRRSVQRWLLLVWAMILMMVVVGGITRLTGSGLSIVEWQPVMGALPPLNDHAWQEVFHKYQSSPQYREVNHWMALSDFKRIFFWEYAHRLLGRLIGAVVLLPWLYFLVRGALPRRLAIRTAGIFVLGGLQGALGWYMVQSGLWDEPRVSHFRLAAHLLLAFLTGQLVLWLALDTRRPGRAPARARGSFTAGIWALLGLLALQIVYGAFMAGTHAGYYYSTFPDMNGAYAPAAFFSGDDSAWRAALTDPRTIHYLHRLFGFALLALAIGLWVFLRQRRPELSPFAGLVGALTFVQFNLGALTVITRLDLHAAVLHQAGGYLLVSSCVLLLYRALAR
jgi:cytochrome c oxidase assembly protein subunit 15